MTTFGGAQVLTGASGFLFERDERLSLVKSRHVLFDEASGHWPDRVEIELHAAQMMWCTRTHRGISGAPVVMNTEQGLSGTSWTLLGVHSSSMDC